MDTTTMPRPVGRPRKTLGERVRALMAKATPEEVSQFQDEAQEMLATQPAQIEDDNPLEWSPSAQNPKLQSLVPMCDKAMARMLSRVDGTWMVRCWVLDPEHPEAKPTELNEFDEPTPYSGCYKLGVAKAVQSCEPDVLSCLRKQGAHGEVTIEFLKAGQPPVALTFALTGEAMRRPAAPAAGRQDANTETIRQLVDALMRQNEALNDKLERALSRQSQQAPQQWDQQASDERLRLERERLQAELEARQRNDPAFSMSKELLSAIMQGGMNRVKNVILGEASPVAPNGMAGATPAIPLSPVRAAAEHVKAAREDFMLAKAMFGNEPPPQPPPPTLAEQAQALAVAGMQLLTLYQSFKAGGPTGAMQAMQGLNALAAQPTLPQQAPLPQVDGDALLRELESKGQSAVA